MLKNYIWSAYRSIVSDKFYSLINIIGLSVGILCAIFIILYIQDELTFDKHHVKHERIYRLESDFTIQNKHDKFAITSLPLALACKIECPEIEEVARFLPADEYLLRYDNKEFFERELIWADSTVFDIFTYPFLSGNPQKALAEQNAIVLTESMAKKYFGAKNPMGEILVAGSGRGFKVTGVIEDMPDNSHMKFDGLLSLETIVQEYGEDQINSMEPPAFWNVNVHSFVLLKENSRIQSVLDKSPAIYEKYMKALGDQLNASFELMATNLADLHFRNHIDADFPQGNKAYVYIFIAVAIFILLVANINYMNLATARSAKRAREVGLRKVMGAHKKQLVGQFLSESVLLALLALVIAFFAMYVFLPIFNDLSDKKIAMDMIAKPDLIIGLILLTFFTGLLSGSYPAFFLSSFIPIKVLKGKNRNTGSGYLRKILVIFQFTIATIMIIGTIVVSQQLQFLKHKNLGFDKDNIVVLTIRDTTFRKSTRSYIQQIQQDVNISGATVSTTVPGRGTGIVVFRVEREGKMVEHAINFFYADHQFLDVYNIKMKEGRFFDKKMATDTTKAFVINEAAAKELGWEKNALGKRIHFGFNLDGSIRRDGKVIGIVEDFNYGSLHNTIEPLVILLPNFNPAQLSVKINGKNTMDAINAMEQIWIERNNKYPFKYEILKDELAENYRAERKLGQIFSIFAIVAIVISCLGLLGLSSFVAVQRTKEIGIRKVLGSTVTKLVALLNREFIVLVLVSIVLACPVAYYAVKNWLNNFAYSIDLSGLYFIVAALLTLIIAISITSIKTLIAARANPADTLRYE